jgi:hypothetical protein
MIAPSIGDGKRFNESDQIRIELTQSGCVRAARRVAPIVLSFHPLHESG